MNSKIHNILRFFTLLFTDKDIATGGEEKLSVFDEEFTSPILPLEPAEELPLRIEPRDIGLEKEEITTKIIPAQKLQEKPLEVHKQHISHQTTS